MAGVPWVWPPVASDSGVGDVLSVFGRTGAVVAVDGDYAGSNITNDSSVPGGTVTEALDNLLALFVSPYIQLPSTPNAFDDEFLAGSNPDLSARGYTVVSGSTTLTRSGDIVPWNTTGPVGNTYWSTIVGSWILIQGAPGVQIDVYKTIALAAGDTYFARTVGSYCMAPAANGRFNELGFYGASGAALDANNRVYSTIRDDTGTNMLITDNQRTTAGAGGSGASGRLAIGTHDIRGIRFDSGTTHYAFHVGAPDGEVKSVNVTGAPAAATMTRFAVRNLFSASGGAVAQIWGIDFIRKKTGNAWLIP